MIDTLAGLGSIWIWVLIGLVLVIALVVVILSTVVKRSAEPPSIAEAGEPPAAGAKAPEPGEKAAAPGGLAASFRRAMGFLRGSAAGRDYRYQIPWYLVAGDPGSGKYSMISGVGSNLSVENRVREPRHLLYWHFLDSGVLIAPAGRCWRSGGSRGEWATVLGLLRNHRPRRPVDGVVLTIAATDLTGPSALDESALASAAARFSEMMSQAERSLGFTFPVYVVVTKCDEIEGFVEFCRELPPKNRDNVFGWSNPYHIDASFSPEWVDEAFDSVARDLQRLQSEIFVERSELKNPENIFLFPENFAGLHTPLSTYLERLFRETAYREAFRFRGLYFCGDPAERVSALELTPEISELDAIIGAGIPSAGPPPTTAPERRNPIFVKDLFEKKIFAEAGVARPLSRVFLVKSRSARIIQAAAAVTAVVLAVGTALAYHSMRRDRELLLPPLNDLYTQRVDSNNLLQEMYAADQVSFSSVFVPASLFSNVDADVTEVMRRACDKWILSILQKRLLERKAQVLAPGSDEGSPGDGDSQDSAGSTAAVDESPQPEAAPDLVSTPTGTPEYLSLSDFHTALKTFQEAVDTYDRLRQTGKLGDMQRIQQLLDYVGLNQVQPRGHLLAALSGVSGPPITFTEAERRSVVEELQSWTSGMFENWSRNNSLTADVERLRQSITALEQASGERLVQRLRTTRERLRTVEMDLASPKFRWAGSPTLQFDDAERRVFTNPIAPGDDSVARSARELGQKYLDGIRLQLLDQRTSMTDHLLVPTPFGFSPGVQRLQLALENTLNLRFMTEIPVVRPIQIRLADNQRLLWKVEPLQEALRLCEIYTQFQQEGLRGAPDGLRVPLARVALEQLKRHVEDLVAGSQEFSGRSAANSGLNSEDETLPEVNSFRAAADPLLKIAEQFKTDGVVIHNSALRIMVLEAYNLLATLERRLNDANPYAIKEGNWIGKGPLALAVFDVRNPAALNEYLTSQREGIRFLEKQAQPLVPFLNAQLPVRGEAQSRLIARWQRIIDDFQQYDAKRPAATLQALEDFIVNEMDKIPENACGANAPRNDETADFFLLTRNNLRTAAIGRCRDVNSVTVCRSYGTLAASFNQSLAAKFPFAPLGAGKTQAEATAEAIKAFYGEFDRTGKITRTLLEQDARFGEAAQNAIQFLNQMEELRPVAIPTGPEVAKEPPLTLNFSPQFRANRGNESGGNQIIEWTMQVGGQIIQQHAEHDGTWRAGNPVRLSLRWANDSALVPVADGQPDLRVIRRNAFFEFTDRWSLLSFIRRHAVAVAETDQSGAPQAYTLRFQVKTARDPNWTASENVPESGMAIVFMQLKLSLAGSKAVVLLPAFPVAAPVLKSCTEN